MICISRVLLSGCLRGKICKLTGSSSLSSSHAMRSDGDATAPNPDPFSAINLITIHKHCTLSNNLSCISLHPLYRKCKKMQAAAAVCLTGALPVRSTRTLVNRRAAKPHRTTLLIPKAVAAPAAPEAIDYSSPVSVFPMEACDILGGEACNAKMFPEVKLEASGSRSNSRAREEVDRDYVEYNEARTVFPGEACDDLGGEFCEAEYQNGVY